MFHRPSSVKRWPRAGASKTSRQSSTCTRSTPGESESDSRLVLYRSRQRTGAEFAVRLLAPPVGENWRPCRSAPAPRGWNWMGRLKKKRPLRSFSLRSGPISIQSRRARHRCKGSPDSPAPVPVRRERLAGNDGLELGVMPGGRSIRSSRAEAGGHHRASGLLKQAASCRRAWCRKASRARVRSKPSCAVCDNASSSSRIWQDGRTFGYSKALVRNPRSSPFSCARPPRSARTQAHRTGPLWSWQTNGVASIRLLILKRCKVNHPV
jgi:hypothetical protein